MSPSLTPNVIKRHHDPSPEHKAVSALFLTATSALMGGAMFQRGTRTSRLICLLVAALAPVYGYVYKTTSTCPGSGACGCGWATKTLCLSHDDGTECNCRCCCHFRGGCVWGSAVLSAKVGSARASRFYMHDLPTTMKAAGTHGTAMQAQDGAALFLNVS